MPPLKSMRGGTSDFQPDLFCVNLNLQTLFAELEMRLVHRSIRQGDR
jgi:hypothetical protein